MSLQRRDGETVVEDVIDVTQQLVLLTAVGASAATYGYVAYQMSDIWNEYSSKAFEYAAQKNGVDVVVLDLGLPGLDGIEVCRRIRTFSDCYIIMLTARARETDILKGFEVGADDYITKPFNARELLARIRALFRRAAPSSRPEVLKFGDLTLDTGTHRAQRGDRYIDLTAKEYELLELFMRNPRRVLTREMIFDRVWGYDFGGESNIIEVYVRYLRQKTEEKSEPRVIHTVRGVGYVLREDE